MNASEAQAHCTQITKRSGSNFYYSFLFLPKARREAMYTVYAFCREVDSVVDDARPGDDPMRQLEQWRAELDAAYGGAPAHPVTISLAHHASACEIPKSYFEELIAGVEMDLTIRRYATFSDLYAYCYRVASVVGLICLKIFGTRSESARDYAVNLGLAFQLTNILRDLRPDAERGRLYLPQEDLARFGCAEDDIFKQQYSTGLLSLLQFECGRARDFYRQAEAVAERLPARDRRTLLAAEIMSGVYSRILDRIETTGYRVFGPRISIPAPTRLVIASGIWLRSAIPFLRSRTALTE